MISAYKSERGKDIQDNVELYVIHLLLTKKMCA